MDYLLSQEEERCRVELYSEYLRKIPALLKQLETVERMHQKALMEEELLAHKDPSDHSVALYQQRIRSTIKQCESRAADIRQQAKLIFALKAQMEGESSTLLALLPKD